MSSLRGKVVWLTGASSGIGEFVALELGRRGAKVAISARRKELLDKVQERINSAGGTCEVFPADVLDREGLKRVSADIDKRLGSIDIVIANAGLHIETNPLKFDSNEYFSLMQLNYGGMLHTLEAVIPAMISRKAGHIATVASVAGFRGLPTAAAYGATKSAMIHFLESIRFHLEEVGIFVTIINPGFVRTPLTDKNDFYMPFLTEPDVAANIICNGLERRKKEISFPFPFNYILKIARILPFPLYSFFVKLLWSRMPRR